MPDPWYEDIKVKPNTRKFPRPVLNLQLAEAVRKCRHRRKLTQADLAKLAGTSQTAIARLETGRGNQTIGVIQRVMDALDYELLLMWSQK